MPTKLPQQRRAETKSMGSARHRNRMEENSLTQRLESLSTRFRCSSCRLRTEMGQLEEDLKLMTSVGGKAIICPKGLSEEEKAQYRQLRRRGSSSPSMTLHEFDARISHFRHRRMSSRRATLTSVYDDDNDVFLPDAGIVAVAEHEFCAPITKHKHTLREAWKRATSGGGAIAAGRTNSRVSPATEMTAPLCVPQPHGSRLAAAPPSADTSPSPTPLPPATRRTSVTLHPSLLPPARATRGQGEGSGVRGDRDRTLSSGAEPRSADLRRRPQSAHAGHRCGREGSSHGGGGGGGGGRDRGIVICPDYLTARWKSVSVLGGFV